MSESNSAGVDLMAVEAGDAWAETQPRTMLELIEVGEPAREWVQRVAQSATSGTGTVRRYSPDEVVWHAPVRRPSKICCIALNNSANSERIIIFCTYKILENLVFCTYTVMRGDELRPVEGRSKHLRAWSVPRVGCRV